MTKILPLLAVLLSAAAFAEETNLADDFYASNYFGISVGKANLESDLALQDFDFLMAGFSLGRQMTPYFGVEGFLSFSANEEKDEVTSFLVGQDVHTSYSVWGVLGTVRSPGKFFVKGKAGLAASTIEYASNGFENEDERAFGLMYSIGGGVEIGNYRLELDYNAYPMVDDPLFDDEKYTPTSFQLTFLSKF